MTTADNTIEFPHAPDFEDGDVFVDANTGVTYVIDEGAWVKANVRVTEQARATFARHRKGAALKFIREGIWS